MAASLARAVAALVLLTAPLGAHLSLATGRATLLVGILVTLQAALVCWALLSPVANAAGKRAIGVAVIVAVGLVWWGMRDNVAGLSAIPHAMSHAGLLALFAASLAPGREAIITGFARQLRGPLPTNIIRYTRRVTWAWCVFFSAQLLISLLLFLFARVAVWSLFVNLLNLPLVVLMFGTEYTYRRMRYPIQSHGRAGAFVRMFDVIRAALTGRGR